MPSARLQLLKRIDDASLLSSKPFCIARCADERLQVRQTAHKVGERESGRAQVVGGEER